MEHSVHVEGFAAGDQRDHDIEEDCEDIGEEEVFDCVHREPDGVDFPLDPVAEWAGDGLQEGVDHVNQVVVGQERVHHVRPVSLEEDVSDASDDSGDERRPGGRRGAALPVEAEDHDRGAARIPDGHRHGGEELDIVKLRHELGAEEEEDAYAD